MIKNKNTRKNLKYVKDGFRIIGILLFMTFICAWFCAACFGAGWMIFTFPVIALRVGVVALILFVTAYIVGKNASQSTRDLFLG